jgi:hypothetical protein
MASYLVRSAGLTTDGTTGADFFQVNSGALSSSTINGLAGADSLQLADDVASATNVKIDLGGDKDILTASGTDFQSSTILLGAGGDIIVGHDAQFGGTVKAGAGNDTITLSAGVVDTMLGGAGADSIIASALISGNKSLIGLGAGQDTLEIQVGESQLSAASIFGGGGNDSIVLSAETAMGGLQINLDSTVNGGGADTLMIAFTGGSAVIKGKGGKDVITVSGELNASSQVLGNAGADNITIDGILSADGAATIGGGSGNDTITLSASTTATYILGGGGRDSINIGATTGADGGGTIVGGIGADSITFSSDIDSTGGEVAQAIGFQSFNDSTANSSDLITFTNSISGGNASGNLVFNIAMDGIGSAETAGTVALNSASITNSVATFSSVSSVADRISKIDGLISTQGQYAVFYDSDDNSAAYLFIQGGSEQDIVARFDNSDAAAMTGLAAGGEAGSAFTIQIGQD